MICNICIANKDKKYVVRKIEKDDNAFGGYKITELIQSPDEPISSGFKLYWDGTAGEECNCETNSTR